MRMDSAGRLPGIRSKAVQPAVSATVPFFAILIPLQTRITSLNTSAPTNYPVSFKGESVVVAPYTSPVHNMVLHTTVDNTCILDTTINARSKAYIEG